MRTWTILMVCVVVFAHSETLAQDNDPQFGNMFQHIMPKLDTALERYDHHNSLPEERWLGTDKKSNQEAINKLLDQAIALLEMSNTMDYRHAIAEREKAIETSRKQIVQYKQERISAPQERRISLRTSPFATTKEGYEKKIAAEEAQIAVYQEEIQQMHTTFLQELARMGLSLQADELDQLLHTVNGDDLLAMSVVFHNVKTFSTHLAQLVHDSGEDLQIARRYYGIYFILLQVLDYMQKQYLQEIDENYIPKLNNYAIEVDKLISDTTQKIVNSISENNKSTLSENRETLKMNREVILFYKDYLLKNRNDIEQRNKRLQEDIYTAENTYKTVLLSSNIAFILKNSTKHFETLSTLTAPNLSEFKNQQMKEEFHKLTARMQNAS